MDEVPPDVLIAIPGSGTVVALEVELVLIEATGAETSTEREAES